MTRRATKPFLNRFFSSTGLPSGDQNILGVGSPGAPIDYWVEALEGETLALTRVVIHIDVLTDILSGGYGSSAMLVNGIQLWLYQKEINKFISISTAFPVKTHDNWGRYCFDSGPTNYSSQSGKSPAHASRWTFEKYGGKLLLNQGDKLGIRVNDDLSTRMLEHTILAQGQHLRTPNPVWTAYLPALT